MERLAREIAAALESRRVPQGISDEMLFERKFVERAVVDTVRSYEQSLGHSLQGAGSQRLEVALHGWKPRGVRTADLDDETRERSEGWTRSKAWSVTNAWGRHTPDIAVRDPESGETLIVEVKFGNLRGGGLPTGELQRMVGQCVLAKLHHSGVVAIFGYRGQLRRADEAGLRPWLNEQGVELVIREVPG